MNWRIHHRAETESTNADAAKGRPGDVFTADFQSGGRGRIGHKWLSPPGANLMMSAVLDLDGLEAAEAATLPLVVGLAVAGAVRRLAEASGAPASVSLKWPNDVFANGRKIAGILCERHGDAAVAGIGLNVLQTEFPPEISGTATSLALVGAAPRGADVPDMRGAVECVRDAVLGMLSPLYERWRSGGFAAVYGEIAGIDWLKGRRVSVAATDGDAETVDGLCGGIMSDGSLDVGGEKVWAGEAHVKYDIPAI